MKRQPPNIKHPPAMRLLVLGAWMFSGCWNLVLGACLEIRITPRFSGEIIRFDSVRYENASKEIFSFTRISFLASGFALQRADGSWLELTNDVAWFDAEKNRSDHRIVSIPAGEYQSLRFNIGLGPALNHGDPAQFAAGHPLNPNLNNLHWSWQGGYIFLALEGRWQNSTGAMDGWSFHLARDPNCTPITLAARLNLTNDTTLELDFDLAALVNAPRSISFARDGFSTHSRAGDPIATALVANLPGAFSIRKITANTANRITGNPVKPLYLPPKFTPYRLQISATFPIPDLPKDNPLTEERVALGEKLFHEPRLSRDNSLSCASCHDADHAFSDPRQFSVGVRGETGARIAMPLFNLAWKTAFFWDGRAPSLREQALMPIQDHVEMDESLTNVCVKLQQTEREKGGKGGRETNHPNANSPFPPFSPAPLHSTSTNSYDSIDYPTRFTAAFGSPEISPEKIGLALEAFLLTLTSHDAKFDRALKGEATLADDEQRGLQLFMTEYDPRRGQYGADCFHCHGGPLFQSQTFANNGLDREFADLGHAKITGKDSDRGKFATPSLRNVALTAPYMHDGRFKSLEEVIEHYSRGVKRSATLDPNLAKHPDGGIKLNPEDQRALVAFLKTLTEIRLETKTGRDDKPVHSLVLGSR